MRAITFATPYRSRASWQMTMLSSSSPVAATSRSGGRLIPARSSTKSSVASPRITWCSNSASSLSNRVRAAARSASPRGRARSSERGEVRADLAAAGDQDVHQRAPRLGLGGTDGARRASRSPPTSGRRCAARATRRTGRAPGRGRGRSPSAPRTASGPPGRSRGSCCRRRSSRRRRRRPRSRPRAGAGGPCRGRRGTRPSSCSPESPERVLVLVEDGDVPARRPAAGARRPSRRGRNRSRLPSRAGQGTVADR